MTDRTVLSNVQAVRNRISQAAVKAGRNPDEVKLIAVTKTVDAEVIREAAECGIKNLGENRVQEAQKKITNESLIAKRQDLCWHLIGHLQKNKARAAVELFDMIQSVDSLKLAEALDNQAEKTGKVQGVLIQVKLSDEESKHGITEENIVTLLKRVAELKNLELAGLMTIPPFFDDPEMARPYFRRLKEMKDEIEKKGIRLRELSMGMSNDFEVAIEEGATMVRVGTAIFGERKKKEDA